MRRDRIEKLTVRSNDWTARRAELSTPDSTRIEQETLRENLSAQLRREIACRFLTVFSRWLSVATFRAKRPAVDAQRLCRSR